MPIDSKEAAAFEADLEEGLIPQVGDELLTLRRIDQPPAFDTIEDEVEDLAFGGMWITDSIWEMCDGQTGTYAVTHVLLPQPFPIVDAAFFEFVHEHLPIVDPTLPIPSHRVDLTSGSVRYSVDGGDDHDAIHLRMWDVTQTYLSIKHRRRSFNTYDLSFVLSRFQAWFRDDYARLRDRAARFQQPAGRSSAIRFQYYRPADHVKPDTRGDSNTTLGTIARRGRPRDPCLAEVYSAAARLTFSGYTWREALAELQATNPIAARMNPEQFRVGLQRYFARLKADEGTERT